MLARIRWQPILNKMRERPGHITSVSLITGLVAYTYIQGPKLESDVHKYVLAGTTATVGMELASHYIDTINIKSKVS
jgi:hypothetical protein